ncbi:putative leucine-rich repeat-containing, plant-type, leucine-rich repeat domain, L [Lupinus albus]|uniref:Putative leucine-rich repeat-containing, plant-type, leucine-rich repeat domain, L n=1 Tax=Lupinus albus TaxID=3870 RepID=A0A6A4QS07_LUPAL|nr:putative leucine-rich repeat-containing, plant-type, leucine-rich repeat domain, L [Lupinus albus]
MVTILFSLIILVYHITSSHSERCNPQEKFVLLQMKKEFNNPTFLSSWKPNTDCCHPKWHWHGIKCDHKSHHVKSINLSYNTKLASKIPPSIGNLPYLETLFLFHLPNLIGPIPQTISKLTNLTYLTISSTNVSGPLPNFLGQFKSLVNLDLSFNNFYGPLPPSLSHLPNLTGIFLGYNNLIGPIPDSYRSFKNHSNFYFSHNNLSGRVPISLGKVDFSSIDLSHNRFKGDPSMLFGSNKVSAAIDLSWNIFSFDIGKVELPKITSMFDASHNQIYGNLPLGIENVMILNVSYNRLCGEIPKGDKHDLYAYFHNKCLCGSPLPSCK